MSKELAKQLIEQGCTEQDFKNALDEINKEKQEKQEKQYKPLYPASFEYNSDGVIWQSVLERPFHYNDEARIEFQNKHEAWLYITSAIHKANWEYKKEEWQSNAVAFYLNEQDVICGTEDGDLRGSSPKALQVATWVGFDALLKDDEFVKQYKIWLS